MLKRRRATKKFGDKKLAVITGASSGAGLEAAANLLRTGEYHVFGAVRDLDKMRDAALGVELSIDTEYPFGDTASISVAAANRTTLKIRIPGWAFGATVNGRQVAYRAFQTKYLR